jgi:hypothetical protein
VAYDPAAGQNFYIMTGGAAAAMSRARRAAEVINTN